MSHLLVIESWVGSMSTLLPRALRQSGHQFTFVTRSLEHYLKSYRGSSPHPLLAAQNVLTAETNDLPTLIDYLKRAHSIFKFDGVLSSCDYYLETVAEVAEQLGLPGPSPTAVRQTCRKDLTRLAMREAGLPTPNFSVTMEWSETVTAAREIGFPLVIKPVDLCAGMFVRKVLDEVELEEAFLAIKAFSVNARAQLRSPQVLLEQLLDGREVSVETVSWRGGTQVVGVTDKSVTGQPWFIENGHMFPAGLNAAEMDDAKTAALEVLKVLGFDHGVAHTEVKLTSNGPRIVEVNPRPAGNRITELVHRVTGIDLAEVCVDLALGREPSVEIVDTGIGSAAISFLLPPRAGEIVALTGTEKLDSDPTVADWNFDNALGRVGLPTSNNEYLGFVSTVDKNELMARQRAEELLAQLEVQYVDLAVS